MRRCPPSILFSLLALAHPLFPDTIEAGRDLEDNDIRALKEWIDTKRQISLKEIGGDLSLSGEVRTEFQSAWERRNRQDLRGSGPNARLPARGFDVEFNFMLDYRTDRTWASIKLEFDDDMGVFNGTLNKIALERAYWGARAISCDDYTLDVEVGRRSMSSLFDSKVQFGSIFDGAVLRYDHAFETLGDYYLRLGAFVVNDRNDQFGYVGEMGLLGIAGTGFYGKLSTIDWKTQHYSEPSVTNRFRFIISQATVGYRFRIASIDKLGVCYSALLWNWAAKKLKIPKPRPPAGQPPEHFVFKRAPWAWYAGVSIGQLLKQWDWAFDVNYQILLAQAVPDFDTSGISIGNADRSGFYTRKITPLDGLGPSSIETAGGTTNYHGYIIRFDLLLTDKLDMQQLFLQSWRWDRDIGPRRRYTQYEIEFIYSW